MKTNYVTERLTATQQVSNVRVLSQGEKDGRKWAERQADAAQLRRLEQARVHEWDFENECSAFSIAELLFFVIEPEWDGSRTAAGDFWETVTWDQRTPDAEYIGDFAKGAMEYWDEI